MTPQEYEAGRYGCKPVSEIPIDKLRVGMKFKCPVRRISDYLSYLGTSLMRNKTDFEDYTWQECTIVAVTSKSFCFQLGDLLGTQTLTGNTIDAYVSE